MTYDEIVKIMNEADARNYYKAPIPTRHAEQFNITGSAYGLCIYATNEHERDMVLIAEQLSNNWRNPFDAMDAAIAASEDSQSEIFTERARFVTLKTADDCYSTWAFYWEY